MHLTSFLCLLVLCGFIPNVASDLTMMIVWGVPDDTKYADVYSNTTWEECVETCFEVQSCILAYQEDTTTCLNFDYNAIDTITKTTSENGTVVAFKVESVAGECPVGESPPTFDGNPANGSLYIDYDKNYFPQWTYYSIELTGDTWQIDYKKNISCVGKFMDIVEHSDGTGYCYTAVYSSNNRSFTYNDSVVLCQNVTLASLHYPEDLTAFTEVAKGLRTRRLNGTNTYVRMDGIRTAECQKTPTSAECMTVEGFTFTGKAPNNLDNYNWVTNAGAQADPDSNCIVLVLDGNQTVQTDVRGCTSSSPLDTLLIQCAGPAWIYG